jgi:hypothetical protein
MGMNLICKEVCATEIYDLINHLTSCSGLSECGQIMIDFYDAAIVKKNRATIVKDFYEQINSFAWVDYVFDDDNPNYIIYQDARATALYIALRLPPMSSPVKSLNAIRDLGHQIIAKFCDPIGKIISQRQISLIMKYLDEEYSFSSKVFSDKKAAFLILDSSNLEFDSECFVGISGKKIIQHLFLYHMKSNDDKITPEGVLFHELGHALQARYSGSISVVPENIVNLFSETVFPTYKSLSQNEQCEVFADALSMGLMFNSPFSEHDPFLPIDKDGKEFFNLLVRKLLSRI